MHITCKIGADVAPVRIMERDKSLIAALRRDPARHWTLIKKQQVSSGDRSVQRQAKNIALTRAALA